MSGSQSRFEKTDYGKPNRSGNSLGTYQRSYSNKNSGGASAAGSGPPPTNNRSFKKTNNVQGGQSVANVQSTAVAPPSQAQHSVQRMGIPEHQHIRATTGTAGSDVSPRVAESSSSSQRINRVVPKAPSSQSPAMNSDTKSITPVKEVAVKPISVQFGSLSPGFVNGIQIPARTISAPPNLDEQKRNQLLQARNQSFQVVPTDPVPAVPKHQVPEKEAVASKQVHGVEPQLVSRLKKESQVSSAPSSSSPHKPSTTQMSGIPMQLPFHQQQLHLPYGVPSPLVPSQVVSGASMHMHLPMPYHMSNVPQLQHQVFMPNMQPHLMQHQGLMHQGQGMSFPAQMGPHISHQLGNIGMNTPPQYPLQQPAKSAPPRKAVVITHPDTRQELKLEKLVDKHGERGLPSIRAHPNMSTKSQTIPPTYTGSPSHNLHPNILNSYPHSLSDTNTQGPSKSSHVNPSFVSKVSISAPPSKEVVNTLGEVASRPTPSKVTAGFNNVPEQSLTSVANKGESAKLMTQGDAKQDVLVVDSGQTSTKLSQDSKHELSVVPVDPITAASNKNSSGVKESVQCSPDDSTKDQLNKPREKGGHHSTLTPSPLEISKDVKPSGSDKPGNLDNTSDMLSLRNLDEKSMRSFEPESKSHNSSPGIPRSYDVKEAAQFLHSAHELTEQKNELLTYSTDKQEGCNDIHSAFGTYVNDNVLLPTESMRSYEDNAEFDNPEGSMKSDIKNAELSSREKEVDDGGFVDVVPSFPVTGSGELLVPDQSIPISASSKGKKKKKELLQKADAAGTTSDLYIAYKAPEVQKETMQSPESQETGIVMDDTKTTGSSAVTEDSGIKIGDSQSKGEPDDWEDAADVASSKVETLDNGEQHGEGELIQHDNEILSKKYSRDFLLKFQSQNYSLPDGFSIIPSMTNVLLSTNGDKGFVGRDSFPSPGRHTSGGPRVDRHGPTKDEWSKLQGHTLQNRDHANSGVGFRHHQGGNFGVPRNQRQAPGHVGGVIRSGPPQTMNAVPRNNTDSENWQRGTNFQRGLIPPPQTPSQLIHKAEKKYEIGKVADEEQAKQRRLKGILNKLTPQNFDKLFEQVKAVNIDSAATLTGVISQIFDKALTEPTFCEMYADFCFHLSGALPAFSEENETITFKRVLLNKCQEEFERGEREQEEADRSEDSETTQTKEEREEKRVQARRRMLGNIRLIGELFKKKMLTERIMHECIKKLLGNHQNQNPDEEDLEALCKLMSTIGEMIDHTLAKPYMDAYFDRMTMLSNDMNLSSRVRFMLKDSIDLRRNKWQQRRKVEGPKKIEEVHKDAAHERQAQANRLARGPGINTSGRRAHPSDFGSRGSNTMPSPNSQSGNIRGYPSHTRGYGNHDVRLEDKPSFESRTLSVPLRTARDDSITLGPQGGLGRGMFNRGSVMMASVPPVDRPLSSGEVRLKEGGYSVNNSVTERPMSTSSEDSVGRSAFERHIITATHDKLGGLDHSLPSDAESRNVSGFDETSLKSSEKTFSVERLQEMSSAAIKEFYSAKDEKELILCINELNSPSFYPSMISLWVTDSFERKDMHRDLLMKLLINLSKPPSGILCQQDLLKGFELVLSTLEDAATDAPMAPAYLGLILSKTITENVIPLSNISHIIYEGGEEPGTLLESGLAGDVLCTILESIQSEKGDSFLDKILSTSDLHLRDYKSKKLEKFIK